MLNADSKQLQALLEAFTQAEQRVQSVLLTTKAGTVSELKIEMNKKLDKISLSLTEQSKKWAEKDLEDAYKEGVQKINGKNDRTLHQSEDSIVNSYIELSTRVQTATDNAKNIINEAIREAEKTKYGATVGNVKDIIQDTLAKENASMFVEYSNGAKMPLDAYASMLARTSRIESSNTGAFDRCNKLGIDLVRCTTMTGCCKYCRLYEGKVYSISGNDTRFPSLYDTALQRGYNIMHPNCRHEFIPFIEELQSPEELKQLIKNSNNFEEPNKDDVLMKKYLKDQATLRQWRSELNEYNKLKAKLGNDMPYSSLGAFRRGRRANSVIYQKLHKQLLDSNNKVLTSKKDKVKISTVKRVEFSADKFPISFQMKKKEAESFNLLSNYINKQPKIDNNVAQLYSKIPSFNTIEKMGIKFQVRHTKHSAVEVMYNYRGEMLGINLNIPNIETEEDLGAINTNLHEIMHYIDHCFGMSIEHQNKMFSSDFEELREFVKKDNGEIGSEVDKLFTEFNQNCNEVRTKINQLRDQQLATMKEKYVVDGRVPYNRYSQYSKEWNLIVNEASEKVDKAQRNLMGGGINALQDIYDALSGGYCRDVYGKTKYGHGKRYYSTITNRVNEIVANYGALSVTRPDLIDLLKKDKPNLVSSLENMVKNMLKGVE